MQEVLKYCEKPIHTPLLQTATLPWWRGLCVSMILRTQPAEACEPLAGTTKPERSKERNQTKRQSAFVVIRELVIFDGTHMHCGVRFHVSCQHSSEAAKRASSWLQGFKCSFHHRFWSTFKARRECKSGFKVYLVKGLISQRRSKNKVWNVQTVDRKIVLLTKML